MLTPEQNTLLYLMFLNGILFLGLNFAACSIVNPGTGKSKRTGYLLIVSALLTFLVQQEYRGLAFLGLPPDTAWKIMAGGFIMPVFLVSLVYYRLQRNRNERSAPQSPSDPS